MNRINWDEYFLVMAKMASSRSTCFSRPVGCVIVKNNQILSTGYNGALPGISHCIEDNQCFRRSQGCSEVGKYDLCKSSHAEANAIALAAKKGVSIDGSTLYCTLEPCITCSKLIIMSGIVSVVYECAYESPIPERDEYWRSILKDSNIETKQLKLNEEQVNYMMNFLVGETSKRK